MDRKPEHIDDLLRERLYNAAPPPPAFVWDNLEAALKKRRRRFFLWFFALGLSTFAGLLGYWSSQINESGSIATAQPDPVISIDQKVNPVSPASPNQDANLQISAPQTPTTENHPAIALRTSPKGAQSDRSEYPYVKPLQPAIDPKTAQQPLYNTTETLSETPDAEPQVTMQGAGDKEVVNSLSCLPTTAPSVASQTLAGLQKSLHESWPEALKPKKLHRPSKRTVKNCYDFSRHAKVWMVDIYSGPSLAQREMFSAPDDRPYLNKRLNSEHPDLAFNAGVRASLMVRGNFLLRTGLHYDQFTEVFEHVDPEYVKYIVEIINQGGVQTIDTVGVEYGEKYLKTYNRYGMLDIPLSGGVELRKGRSGFNINAGVSFNLMFMNRGAILSPDTGEPVWFTPGKGSVQVYKLNTGMSATFSIQWFYHLKSRTRVFIEPSFKKVFNSISVSSHPVQQRYGIGGLRLGLTKILN